MFDGKWLLKLKRVVVYRFVSQEVKRYHDNECIFLCVNDIHIRIFAYIDICMCMTTIVKKAPSYGLKDTLLIFNLTIWCVRLVQRFLRIFRYECCVCRCQTGRSPLIVVCLISSLLVFVYVFFLYVINIHERFYTLIFVFVKVLLSTVQIV